MSELKCRKHGCDLIPMGGRSAHISNWYCALCDEDAAMTPQAEISVENLIKRLEESRDSFYALAARYKDTPAGKNYSYSLAETESIISHLRRLQEVEAELEKCRRDARRYLAIRNGCGTDLYSILNEYHEPDEFDKAIDAAISAGEGKDEEKTDK